MVCNFSNRHFLTFYVFVVTLSKRDWQLRDYSIWHGIFRSVAPGRCLGMIRICREPGS